MDKRKLNPKAEARLNEILRPAEDVDHNRVVQGILETLEEIQDREERVAVLAYVFACQHYAYLSGPRTSVDKYPEAPEIDGRTARAFDPDRRILRNIQLLIAQLAAEGANVTRAANRAVAFLDELPETGIARFVALHVMFHERTFAGASQPGALRFEDGTDESFHAVLWKHRDVLRTIDGILGDPRTQTKASRGANILAELQRIPDERERAMVFGFVFERQAAIAASPLRGELAALAAVLDMGD